MRPEAAFAVGGAVQEAGVVLFTITRMNNPEPVNYAIFRILVVGSPIEAGIGGLGGFEGIDDQGAIVARSRDGPGKGGPGHGGPGTGNAVAAIPPDGIWQFQPAQHRAGDGVGLCRKDLRSSRGRICR